MPLRQFLLLCLFATLAAITWVYFSTLVSIVNKWDSDASYSHGYLILPVVLWLVWIKREEVRTTDFRPSWFGVLFMLSATVVWVVARGTGVLVVEQIAVVAMCQAAVLAILGEKLSWALIFPLAFLLWLVPFGNALNPWLMDITAGIATAALKFSGIPVLRSDLYITVPAGRFEVARACSGLNYLVALVVFGFLYAHLTYRKWAKRLLFVAAAIVIPIIANGLRVYITIAVSQLTDMRFGPGAEHVTFGNVFFFIVIGLVIWVGRRWRDDDDELHTRVQPADQPVISRYGWLSVTPAFMALLVVPTGPWYLGLVTDAVAKEVAIAGSLTQLPPASQGWTGPSTMPDAWRPLYKGMLAEQSGVYTDSSGKRVDVWLGVYGLGSTAGDEMISFGNIVYASEHKSFFPETLRSIQLGKGQELGIREVRVLEPGGERLVWLWYYVGDRAAASDFSVKALEAWAFIRREAATERAVMVATSLEDDGSDVARLESFVRSHSMCVPGGFSAKGCAR